MKYDEDFIRLKELKDGWQGPGSKAPTKSLQDAQYFAELLETHNIPKGYMSCSASGDIGFGWPRKASVRLEGDNFFGYAIHDGDSWVAGEKDAYLYTYHLPSDFLKVFENETTKTEDSGS